MIIFRSNTHTHTHTQTQTHTLLRKWIGRRRRRRRFTTNKKRKEKMKRRSTNGKETIGKFFSFLLDFFFSSFKQFLYFLGVRWWRCQHREYKQSKELTRIFQNETKSSLNYRWENVSLKGFIFLLFLCQFVCFFFVFGLLALAVSFVWFLFEFFDFFKNLMKQSIINNHSD